MSVYYYIFYKLYRLLEKGEMPWWSDFKAGFLIAAIEGLLIALIDFKAHKLFGIADATELGKWGYILIIGGPPLILNYFLFLYGNRWKEIVRHFDEANRQEKNKMNLQMAVVLLLMAGIFVFLVLL